MICSLSMSGKKRRKYLEKQAGIIRKTQVKNARARKSHRKAALQRLHQAGIYISLLPRCQRE
jgi:hypothetical protein